MNKVFLSGNLTRDPEMKYTQNGKAMARMGIAVNRRFKNAETGQYDVDFFNLTAWEKTAEFCGRYLKKGSRVLVEGSMRTYNYTGQDGVNRSGIDVWVDNIEFAGGKRDDSNYNSGNRYNSDSQNRYDNRPAMSAPASENDFAGGDDFGDADFAGNDIPDNRVPF